MPRLKNKKYLRSQSLHTNQYIDRYGRFRDLPQGEEIKPRTGIFGVTFNASGKLLVTSPPHAQEIFGLPGGGREGIESHTQTLQREYFEEVGSYSVIKGSTGPIYKQRVLYYAVDADEYWQYDQIFYVVIVYAPKTPTSRWITPEGGHAQWIPRRDFQTITAVHQPAIEVFLT